MVVLVDKKRIKKALKKAKHYEELELPSMKELKKMKKDLKKKRKELKKFEKNFKRKKKVFDSV